MFKEILQDLVDRADGGVAGLLMASDGIAIDQYSKVDGPFDIESVGMEYSVVLKGMQRASEMLDAGSTKEVSVETERLTTVVRMLSDEVPTVTILVGWTASAPVRFAASMINWRCSLCKTSVEWNDITRRHPILRNRCRSSCGVFQRFSNSWCAGRWGGGAL